MRTNIEIDDELMDAALRAGPFKTKKDAVEAGLRLLARQAAQREILRWEGKLHWDGDADDGDAGALAAPTVPVTTTRGQARAASAKAPIKARSKAPSKGRRHAGG